MTEQTYLMWHRDGKHSRWMGKVETGKGASFTCNADAELTEHGGWRWCVVLTTDQDGAQITYSVLSQREEDSLKDAQAKAEEWAQRLLKASIPK